MTESITEVTAEVTAAQLSMEPEMFKNTVLEHAPKWFSSMSNASNILDKVYAYPRHTQANMDPDNYLFVLNAPFTYCLSIENGKYFTFGRNNTFKGIVATPHAPRRIEWIYDSEHQEFYTINVDTSDFVNQLFDIVYLGKAL